jgi:hypothetical protein
MIAPSSNKVWFWFPCLVLLCLIGCLVDSVFFLTSGGVSKGNKRLILVQARGVIAATLHHETHNPPTLPLAFGGERISTDQFDMPRFSPTFFPRVDWSGPDDPTPSEWWQIGVPHLFLIAGFLAAWLGTRRWWQRRKSRLLKLHAAPPP